MHHPTVDFQINLDLDAQNWWVSCNRVSSGTDWKQRIEPTLQKQIVGKSPKESFKFLIPYLKEKYQKDDFIQQFKKEAEGNWRKVEKPVFERLEKITGKPICRQKFICFLTTFPRGPYSVKSGWFMLYPRRNPVCYPTTITHELMHFQFHAFYWEKCQKMGLSEDQINTLKEALTVLLNEEFSDLLSCPDGGYPQHKKLRSDLLKLWRKEKNLDKLIESAKKLF